MKRWWMTAMAATWIATVVSCGEEAPTLPPADSMNFINFAKGNPSGARKR
jgi:hypothetical protein